MVTAKHVSTMNGVVPYGRRLFTSIVDDVASTNPSRTFVHLPRSSLPADGWEPITYQNVANGINNVAHHLLAEIGSPQPQTFPTVAYIGPNDIRYVLFILGAVKAGYKTLIVSIRNTLEGQISLLKATDCRFVCRPASHATMVDTWRQEGTLSSIRTLTMPDCDELIYHTAKPVDYNKTWEEAEWEPLAVMHTSGSTGNPKPVVVPHGAWAITDSWNAIPNCTYGTQLFLKEWRNRCTNIYNSMPLFHGSGLGCMLILTLFFGITSTIPHPNQPPSAQLVMESLPHFDVDAVFLPPFVVNDLGLSEHGPEALKKFKFVSFTGASISAQAANRLAEAGVQLANGIGSTEWLPYASYYQPEPKLWDYFIFDDDLMGLKWRQVDDNVYEQFALRKDPKHPGSQAIFYTYPDLMEYATKDLYTPHPTLPNHWAYYGRLDSIITFANGSNLNPLPVENAISSHRKVAAAVLTGRNRLQPALMLEPTESVEDVEAFIDEVWPLIVEADAATVANFKILKDLVLVTSPEKPFARAGKGSVLRVLTEELYQDEIIALYKRRELLN